MSSNLCLPSVRLSLLYCWNFWVHPMSRAVQEGCIASCVRLPNRTHTWRLLRSTPISVSVLWGKPFFRILHLLRSLFSSTYNLLLNNIFWRTLHSWLFCYDVELLDEDPMVHRIVWCRPIGKCCTGNHTSLVTIFDVLSQVK